MKLEQNDLWYGRRVVKITEVMRKVRVNFLADSVEVKGDEVDLQVLHDNHLICDRCIVLYFQINGWFRCDACGTLIL